MSDNKVRKFQHLNHPEPDENGVQRYSVVEVVWHAGVRTHYVRVADNLTLAEAERFISERGEWDD